MPSILVLARRSLIVASLGFAPPLAAAPNVQQTAAAGAALQLAQDAPLQDGQAVFLALLGEMAWQHGESDLAVQAYAELAQHSHDPLVTERAVELAGMARRADFALPLARQWAKEAPDDPHALQTLAGVLAATGQFAELAPLLEKILAADESNLGDNFMRLGRMLSRTPDHRGVLVLLDQLAQRYPQVPEAHFVVAGAALTAEDHERAIAEAKVALMLRPGWQQAAMIEAHELGLAAPEAAIDFLVAFLNDYPQARDVRLQLARLFIVAKRYGEARGQFDRLLQDFPDNPEVVYPVAVLALQQNDLDRAATQFERLLQLDFPDRSSVHYFLGQIEEERKHPEEALAHYRQVVAGDQYLPALGRAVQLLADGGHLDQAQALLHDARAHNAQEEVVFVLMEAQLLRGAKRYQEVFDLLEGALKKHPDDAELLYDAALAADRLGRYGLSETHLRRLLVKQPENAYALNALGYSLVDRNVRLDEGRQLIAKALSLVPDDPFVMDSLAWADYRLGRLEDARVQLEKAYALRADPEIAAHLGEVLWQLTRREEAVAVWRKAAADYPDNEALAAAIRKYQP